jgi:hypothetical protein
VHARKGFGGGQKESGGALAPPPVIHEGSMPLAASFDYGHGSAEPASMRVWRPFGNVVGTQLSA